MGKALRMVVCARTLPLFPHLQLGWKKQGAQGKGGGRASGSSSIGCVCMADLEKPYLVLDICNLSYFIIHQGNFHPLLDYCKAQVLPKCCFSRVV